MSIVQRLSCSMLPSAIKSKERDRKPQLQECKMLPEHALSTAVKTQSMCQCVCGHILLIGSSQIKINRQPVQRLFETHPTPAVNVHAGTLCSAMNLTLLKHPLAGDQQVCLKPKTPAPLQADARKHALFTAVSNPKQMSICLQAHPAQQSF